LDERGSVNSAENDFTDEDDKGDLATKERRMLRLWAKEMRKKKKETMVKYETFQWLTRELTDITRVYCFQS